MSKDAKGGRILSILSNSVLSAAIGAAVGSLVTVGLNYFADRNLQLAEYQLREISDMQYREFASPYGMIYADVANLFRSAALMPAEVLTTNANTTTYYCYNQITEECTEQLISSIQSLRSAVGSGRVSDEVIETYIRAAQRKLAELPANVERSTSQISKSDLPAQRRD